MMLEPRMVHVFWTAEKLAEPVLGFIKVIRYHILSLLQSLTSVGPESIV